MKILWDADEIHMPVIYDDGGAIMERRLVAISRREREST
jgi:hypothetical protein